jgi:formylglycine-generating enzyme required for sulfatase activity
MVRLPGADAGLAMSTTEITYAQWDACYRESGCHDYLADDGLGRGDRPAANMTWLDVLDYLAWLKSKPDAGQPCADYRLPTELEWQAAARYSAAGPLSWREAVADSDPVCWGCGAGQDGAAAVHTGSAPADPAGLYDMIGNVWEWTSDSSRWFDWPCTAERLRHDGACSTGRVMGGSYATRVDALPRIEAGGTVPRTGNDDPWSSPTVGLRVACDVKRA